MSVVAGRARGATSEESGTRFDLIVIGGGAAGSTVAFDAAEQGHSVAMIEEWKVGGTCLNAGCDPTKTMVRSAEVLHLARTASRFGIRVDNAHVDWRSLRARVDAVIDTIRGGDGDRNVRDAGIHLFKDHARFISEHEVIVGGQVLMGDRILIATGSTMRHPTIEGIDEIGYITNVEAVSFDRLPASLAIVGGGPIAVEFAQIFARFGVEVTIVASREQLLPKEEAELSDALRVVLESEGIRVVAGARVTSARLESGKSGKSGNKVLAWASSDGAGEDTTGVAGTVVVEEVLLATGRVPNVDRLALDTAGVAYSERGIEVDATMRTSVPHIFAVGDVTGIYPFTHAADYQARIAMHNAFSDGPPVKADYRVVPWTTFTDPELARVGLTENEAIAGGYAVVSATVPFNDVSRAIVADERTGCVKLVVDRASHQILGGHILGAHAGELIAEVALAMRHRLPISAIASTIHSYPTLSEAVFWTAYQIVNEKLADSVAIAGR